jgi:hypothetical protein
VGRIRSDVLVLPFLRAILPVSLVPHQRRSSAHPPMTCCFVHHVDTPTPADRRSEIVKSDAPGHS